MVIGALFWAAVQVIVIAACGWQIRRMLTCDLLRLPTDDSSMDAREGDDADHELRR